MEEAIFLTRFATKVTVIHRRDQFRRQDHVGARAKTRKLIPHGTAVEDVLDVSKKKSQLKLRNGRTDKAWDFPTSAMFLGIGHEPNARMFNGVLDMDQDGYLKTRDFVFTNVPGVFACGDVQDRRYRQAITAAGSARRRGNGSGEVLGRTRKIRFIAEARRHGEIS